MGKSISAEEFSAHFPKEISKSICRYVSETVLRNSRYVFIQSVCGVQFAYCTHCNKRHRTTVRLKHKQKDKVKCPHCRSMCEVRAAGVSRKYMQDTAVFVWYEKSVVSPTAITARIIEVYRDYSGDFKEVITKYNCSHMYLFEPGNAYYFQYGKQRASVYSAFDNHFSGMHYGVRHMSISNIKKAVKGTAFQYSTWEQYTKYRNPHYVSDMVEFFDLAARYPCIEYLTKSGLKHFVDAKLYRENTWGAVYWPGKTMQKVLRLSKAELNELREIIRSGVKFGLKHLRYYQIQRKRKAISLQDAYILADATGSFYKSYYDDAVKLANEEKVQSYILKQVRNQHYEEATDMLRDWHDYQRECKQLGMDLLEERYLFPNNLPEAHRETSRRVKLKADRKINKKIAGRLTDLNAFCFEDMGLFLRPAASSIELFNEGKVLNHCVGGYTDRYASGHCDIFLVRRVGDPDKPYYTMEVVNGKVMQCRGAKNVNMTSEIKAFVERFVSERLSTKIIRKQSKKPKEVAV
jgi:hypothetical protein